MRRLGKVLHLTNSGRLVLRSKIKVKAGSTAFDEDLVPIGTVLEVFGPVGNPYVSIKPNVNNPGKYVGHVLYVDEQDETWGKTR
ncbi:MAG: Gar1/Naf1 family protein [Candidatus Bathyarchaeia archaeon]